MGAVHARAIRALGVDLVAVSSSTPASAHRGAVELGAMDSVSSADALLERKDIDVVHICVPNHLHSQFASEAIRQGLHVVCEKPIATSFSDAADMLSEAADRKVVAAVPFVYRYYSSVREARRRVVQGEVGRVHAIHGSYLQDWLASADDTNWRAVSSLGGASRAFADIGVHWCDLAEFVTGQRIVEVCARTSQVYEFRGSPREPVDTEDIAIVQFQTDGGAVGSVVVSQVSPGRKNQLRLSVDGSDESVIFDQESPDTLEVASRSHSLLIRRGNGDSTIGAPYSILPPGHPQGYQESFNAFVSDVYDAIGGKVVDGLPTFVDGARASLITDCVLESAEKGIWVTVPMIIADTKTLDSNPSTKFDGNPTPVKKVFDAS